MKTKHNLKSQLFTSVFAALILFAVILAGCADCNNCGCDCGGTTFELFQFSRKIHGSGNVLQEERSLARFTQVVLSEEGDLFVDTGEREKLVVEAEDNLQEYLVAVIQNGVLDIKKSRDKIQLKATQPIRYYLTVPALEGLTLKNSGDAKVAEMGPGKVRIRVSGSGSVHIGRLDAAQLDVALTSSGGLAIDTGVVGTQNITLSSSGEYAGGAVVSQNVQVRLSSSGGAHIQVHERLEADLSSSGNVYYTGNPSVRVTDASSSGRVIKRPAE